jgi:hypothetical protein
MSRDAICAAAVKLLTTTAVRLAFEVTVIETASNIPSFRHLHGDL